VSIHNKNKDTVLHRLAMKGNLHLLIRLLRHLHDVDIRNDNGETLLLCAVQVGNEEAVDQLLQTGADLFASFTAGSECEARRQLELSQQNCKAEEELEKSTLDALTTWGNTGKDSRNRCTLQPGKGTETSSNSFSTLAWTLRLKLATKGPHYITLRLESMKMCSNYFGKRVSMLLGKDCFWDDSVRLHFLIHG